MAKVYSAGKWLEHVTFEEMQCIVNEIRSQPMLLKHQNDMITSNEAAYNRLFGIGSGDDDVNNDDNDALHAFDDGDDDNDGTLNATKDGDRDRTTTRLDDVPTRAVADPPRLDDIGVTDTVVGNDVSTITTTNPRTVTDPSRVEGDRATVGAGISTTIPSDDTTNPSDDTTSPSDDTTSPSDGATVTNAVAATDPSRVEGDRTTSGTGFMNSFDGGNDRVSQKNTGPNLSVNVNHPTTRRDSMIRFKDLLLKIANKTVRYHSSPTVTHLTKDR